MVGRLRFPSLGTLVSRMVRTRNEQTGDSSGRVTGCTGPNWTKTSVLKACLPGDVPGKPRPHCAAGLKAERLADPALEPSAPAIVSAALKRER